MLSPCRTAVVDLARRTRQARDSGQRLLTLLLAREPPAAVFAGTAALVCCAPACRVRWIAPGFDVPAPEKTQMTAFKCIYALMYMFDGA